MGQPKGLLMIDGARLIDRTLAVFDALQIEVVLVGERREYADVPRAGIRDEPREIGPLGGLIGLLRQAGPRPTIAVACDLPYLSGALIERLVAAPESGAVVAPRRGERWEPLVARYDSCRVLPAAESRAREGRLSLQGLLDEVGAVRLPLPSDEQRQLDDWDTPDDIARR